MMHRAPFIFAPLIIFTASAAFAEGSADKAGQVKCFKEENVRIWSPSYADLGKAAAASFDNLFVKSVNESAGGTHYYLLHHPQHGDVYVSQRETLLVPAAKGKNPCLHESLQASNTAGGHAAADTPSCPKEGKSAPAPVKMEAPLPGNLCP